jgi:non-specific serine/threonine protein kinase
LESAGDFRRGLGDAGPILDPRAKAEYRARLEDLRLELEEATSFNDPGRAERAAAEMETISRELGRAVGLSGRDRIQGSAAERTRLRVTRALRRAIEKISEESRDLGEHLQRSVTTGTFCSYSPEPRSPIRWRL